MTAVGAGPAWMLRRHVEARVERLHPDWTDEEKLADVRADLLRGVRVMTLREQVAAETGVGKAEAARVCEAAVESGELVKRGGGSNVAYADGEAVRAEDARRDHVRERREMLLARLRELGVDVHLPGRFGSDASLVLTLDAAEVVADRLDAGVRA